MTSNGYEDELDQGSSNENDDIAGTHESYERLEQAHRMSIQQVHYSYLNQLQSMARELPFSFQQRLPYDLLSSLASSLLDGTMFNIVVSLREVQQLEERNLLNQRIGLINEYKAQQLELHRKHKDLIQSVSHQAHNLPRVQEKCRLEAEVFEQRHEEEMKRRDMKIILELDQKVMDQQNLLEKAGIPGFNVTNNPQEIRLQMYLLDFITRITPMSLSNSS